MPDTGQRRARNDAEGLAKLLHYARRSKRFGLYILRRRLLRRYRPEKRYMRGP